MFGKLNKLLFGAVLIGGIMSGSCKSSEYNGFSSFDDVYSVHRNLRYTSDLISSQQLVHQKILATQQVTRDLNHQTQIAFLWKARKILGSFFHPTIDCVISSMIGFDVNDTRNYEQYVSNRFVLAYTLFQSQSNTAPNITVNNIEELDIENLTLSDGYTPCILGYAIEILDDLQGNTAAQSLMDKIEELKS